MEYNKWKRNTEFSCDNSLYPSRFKTTLSYLRQTDLLTNNTSPSKVQTLYTTVRAVCFYSTWMCAIVDTYVHRYDLKKAMEKIHMGFAMSIIAWVNFICR